MGVGMKLRLELFCRLSLSPVCKDVFVCFLTLAPTRRRIPGRRIPGFVVGSRVGGSRVGGLGFVVGGSWRFPPARP